MEPKQEQYPERKCEQCSEMLVLKVSVVTLEIVVRRNL